MKIFTNNIIKKGILGILVLFVLLVPVSISVTTSDVLSGVFVAPQLAIEINTAAAALLDFLGIGEILPTAVNGFINVVGQAMMGLAAMITWSGGMLLEVAIKEFVLGMGNQINGQGLGTAIDESWKLIRDISNLAFIFGFIYTGIRTILDPNDSGYKRFLSKIIIGALLINFSLFFVKVVIDIANFTSVQIYNAMISGDGSLSATITDKLGLISFYNTKNGNILEALTTKTTPFTFYIMASIFLVVSGFVFAASAIMIVVRFITLIFIMIFSPILFAATVFPQTEKYASELWAKLMSSAFYVPVYLILTFVSIKLIESANLSAPGNTFASALVSPTPGSFGIILQFIVIIFFMMQSILIANKFSITGADAITSKTRTLIGASTAGLAARAGRASVGRFGNWASEKEGLKDAASQSGPQGYLARMALRSTRGAADASFDARNTGLGKNLKVGEGRKGGWNSVKKEVAEAEEKFAKSLGEVGDDDFRVEARKKKMGEMERHVRELNVELNAIPKTEKEARKKMTERIEAAKHHVHEAKVEYETEKQRRILGSTFEDESISTSVNKSIKEQMTNIKAKKDSLKAQWEEYVKNTTTDIRKKELEPGMKEIKKAIKDSEDALHKFRLENTDMGYAGTLESSTLIKSWPVGRLVTHQKAAGKAMRKARKDGLPKEKDDHGGGHGKDDHGGGGGEHVADHDDDDNHGGGHASASVGSIILPFSGGGGARPHAAPADHGADHGHGHGGGGHH